MSGDREGACSAAAWEAVGTGLELMSDGPIPGGGRIWPVSGFTTPPPCAPLPALFFILARDVEANARQAVTKPPCASAVRTSPTSRKCGSADYRNQPPFTSLTFPFTPIRLILSSSLLASERLPISFR